MIVLQLFLEDRPQVLNGVEIGRISRPVHDLLQKPHDLLAGMAWRPVLEEMGGAMKVHELKKLLVEHCHVAIAVHRRLGGQKVDRSSAALAAKAAPDHHTGRMFDVNNSKALLVKASQGRPSNFLASRVDDRKRGLV